MTAKQDQFINKPAIPNDISSEENMQKLNELYHRIKSEKMSPSDLILSNVYTEFLFHRNLITDREQRVRLDRMFKDAFKTIK